MLEKQRLLPSAEELKTELPLSKELEKIKLSRDEEIKSALLGKSGKRLIVVGPCSAHDFSATLEYAVRLGKLAEKVKDKLVLVPRIYTNKPRTRGVGYQGMFLQPDPNGEADMSKGLKAVRKLHLSVLNESGLSGADELLFPELAEYSCDLVSYYAVGARSVENPLHRQVASGLEVAVGMKNPMSGNLQATVNAVFAAQTAQIFKFGDYQVRSSGNPYAHAVLRGGVDAFGKDISNYDERSLERVWGLYQDCDAKNPATLIDANHSNSGKKFFEQAEIVKEVVGMCKRNEVYARLVKGFMIESFLEQGNQATAEEYGRSITDPCLGWADTERLILELAEV